MSCDIGEATGSLENELRSFSKLSVTSPTSQLILILQAFSQQSSFSKLSVASPTSLLILILQAFRHFTYVTAHSDSPSFPSLRLLTAHSPTLPSLYPRHNSFSNPSVASRTSQLILQPFFRFFYVTGFSLTSPGEPPMLQGCSLQISPNMIFQLS